MSDTKVTPGSWVRDYENGVDYFEHRDGIDWFHAAPPPRRHHCEAQSRGAMSGVYVERCACSAIRINRDGWMEKNGRRDHDEGPKSYHRASARFWLRWSGASALVALPALALSSWVTDAVIVDLAFGGAVGSCIAGLFNAWSSRRKARAS